MKTRTYILGTLAVLAVFLNSFCPAAEPPSLLGEWVVVAGERGGKALNAINYAGMRWTFTKDALVLHAGRSTPAGMAGKPPLKCSYVLDDTKSPRHLNWTLGEGEKKRTVSAIYELKDGVLRICMAKGFKERPEGFETEGTECILYELKRSSDDDEPSPGAGTIGPRELKDELVGVWKVVSMEARGKALDEINYAGMRWTFAKDRLLIRPGHYTPAGIVGKPLLKCSYAVDDTQSPRHLNWTLGEGEKKRTVSAIYELKDGVLRICFAKGGKDRPQGFETQGTESVVYRLTRAKP